MDELPIDATGIPTPVCPLCGCDWIMVPMTFDYETYDVAAWGTEGECFSCKSKVTVCCPVDKDSERI